MEKKEIETPSAEEVEKSTQTILKKMKDENVTLQQAVGISDTFLEELYSLAHAHYERGNYKESISLFQFLAGCAPNHYKYMLGLAANLHQMGEYSEAIQGFRVALDLNPVNPMPIYYIADCFLRLGEEEEAAPFYEMMVQAGKAAPEYAEFANKSLLILEGLKKKKKKKSK